MQSILRELVAWHWIVLAVLLLLLAACCCCGCLLCWWKERRLKRMLLRRLAQEGGGGGGRSKVSPEGSPRAKKPTLAGAGQSWRRTPKTGASSPSNEFEYISFTSDGSQMGTPGWNSLRNTIGSDKPRLVSRAVQSDHRPSLTPVAMSTLDWPPKAGKQSAQRQTEHGDGRQAEALLRGAPWPTESLVLAPRRAGQTLDTDRRERIIPIAQTDEQNWSEEELDTDRMSFVRLRREPERPPRVYFGGDGGALPSDQFDGGFRGPTVVRRELVEEYEEISRQLMPPDGAVQELLQVQIDEQTRSIISAIRDELKRFTPPDPSRAGKVRI